MEIVFKVKNFFLSVLDLKVMIILLFILCWRYWILEVLILVVDKVVKIDFVDVECEGVNSVDFGCFGILLLIWGVDGCGIWWKLKVELFVWVVFDV